MAADMQPTEEAHILKRPPTPDLDLPQDIKVRHSITIQKPREEVFNFWRNFENLSLFFKDVQSVVEITPTRSHWTIKLSNGLKAEWDADVIQEVEGRLISWASTKDSKVDTRGTVVFEDAIQPGRSIVRLAMNYSVPGGKLTEWATFFSGEDPDTLTIVNLKRLKAFLETGEIPTTKGQTSGRKEH